MGFQQRSGFTNLLSVTGKLGTLASEEEDEPVDGWPKPELLCIGTLASASLSCAQSKAGIKRERGNPSVVRGTSYDASMTASCSRELRELSVQEFAETGKYICVFDPLDGSSYLSEKMSA